MKKQRTYIDLFAGCGGLSLGLHNAGWKGLFAIEKSPDAFKTLQHNLIIKKKHFDWPHWLPQKPHDIDQLLVEYKDHLQALNCQLDLVVGGPPCQGFSMAGRRKEDDVRNGLIRSYLKFIMYVRPKVIFFENVKGFTQKHKKNKLKGIAYAEYVLRVLGWLGYDVKGKMTDFSEYGVPQRRARFILVGVRKDIADGKKLSAGLFFDGLIKNKKSFLTGKGLPENPSLGCAISDLLKINGVVHSPDRKGFFSGTYSAPKSSYQKYYRSGLADEAVPDSHSFAKHTSRTEERFRFFVSNQKGNKKLPGNIRQRVGVNKHTIFPLVESLPTPTLTTLPDDFIHYCEPRILTVREYARVQTFPDWFEFRGAYTTGGNRRAKDVPRYTQIGNAIPPLFGEQAGMVLKKILIDEPRVF